MLKWVETWGNGKYKGQILLPLLHTTRH